MGTLYTIFRTLKSLKLLKKTKMTKKQTFIYSKTNKQNFTTKITLKKFTSKMAQKDLFTPTTKNTPISKKTLYKQLIKMA